ncbi:MAG TPA: 2-phosphosulfolactate phosphatase [Deinococcales bacterium]|nr:2-phosphosulfolactate phosphatase [Deinococcales bacterium]
MRLRVDLVPRREGSSVEPFADTVLVVDVIRATTTATVYLENGAEALHLVRDLDTARAIRVPDSILAGERGGVAPEGFDLGNSPLEAAARRFDGRTVIMSTSNGTVAAADACESGQHVMLACLRNAHAAARKARELAAEEIVILCAGAGGRAGLDDVYTAGVLAEYLLALGDWQLDDGARVALTVRRQFADPLEPLDSSQAAGLLRQVGLAADVVYCAEVSRSTIVPAFAGRSGPALVFKA